MPAIHRFSKLFEPGYIGKMRLKNRIVMAPMGTGLTEPAGHFSQRQIDYYVARAKGGTGLIITETVKAEREIDPPISILLPLLNSTTHVFRANELVEAVHDYGAKIAIQLSVGHGRNTDWASPDRIPVSASRVPAFVNPDVLCRELSVQEIRKLVATFASAAELAVTAGFDMIEIHGHTGYLLDQFMTPLWNKRTDEYGGDLEGRLRFAGELIRETRSRIGSDIPLGFRISAEHKFEGGRTLAETREIAKQLEAGGIDVLHIDAGSYEAIPWIVPPIYWPQGAMIDLAASIKEVVEIPVITVGSINRPALAEQVLVDGKADFIALGRQLIADPDWANKVREERLQDIIPCIRCNEYCIGRAFAMKPISCTVNPTVGKEQYYDIRLAEKPRKVVVVGGGPAGMEAARVAALKGHKVTLYEKEEELGGQLRAGSRPPFKKEIAELLNYLAHQVRTSGIKLELGKELTPELIDKLRPDAVVVAIGARPAVCRIPGVQRENVITAMDYELGHKQVRGNNVAVVGGGLVGCETALALAESGKKVTIVEMLPELGRDLNQISRMLLLSLLAEKGVDIRANMTVTEFTGEGLTATDRAGNPHTFRADTVVCAFGSEVQDDLPADIETEVAEFYAVGDCVSPRKIGEAIREGFVAGWRI